eukprot:TRINITY_DN51211_c0_g1_i1.p1 TRINITY_DN51211_c0_g1~~TRINITY_DN51211_c0_g1_i1.p1  ORF type:complete len:508 (+),score=112.21 TRINITY_DN51211_c0_g1_i1:69-1592(+)
MTSSCTLPGPPFRLRPSVGTWHQRLRQAAPLVKPLDLDPEKTQVLGKASPELTVEKEIEASPELLVEKEIEASPKLVAEKEIEAPILLDEAFTEPPFQPVQELQLPVSPPSKTCVSPVRETNLRADCFGQPFFLLPSVGTWLLKLPVARASSPPKQSSPQKQAIAWTDFGTVQRPPSEHDDEWENDFQSCPPSRVLAPPPASPALAVGATAAAGASEIVVVLSEESKPETKQPAQPKSAATLEELIGSPTADDDEEGLLGEDGAAGEVASPSPLNRLHDGLDSASESELGDQSAKAGLAGSSRPPPSSTASKMIAVPDAKAQSASAPSASGPGKGMKAAQPSDKASDQVQHPSQVKAAMRSTHAQEASGTGAARGPVANFRVTVPDSHPGLQYRKSMELNDRGEGFKEKGALVSGIVERGGETDWLRLADGRFLPMKVKGLQVLVPVASNDEQNREGAGAKTSPAPGRRPEAEGFFETILQSWFCGCHGSTVADSDVVVQDTNHTCH